MKAELGKALLKISNSFIFLFLSFIVFSSSLTYYFACETFYGSSFFGTVAADLAREAFKLTGS